MTVSGGSLTAESITAGGFSITGGSVNADSVSVSGAMTVGGGSLNAKSITAGGFSITGGLISANSVNASSFAVSGGSIKLPDGVSLMNGKSPASLCLLKVENPDGLEVCIDGNPWTPGRHSEGDFLYAWLSQEEHTVKVGDKTTAYHYDRSTGTFDASTGTPYYDPTDGGNKRAEPVTTVMESSSTWTEGWYVADASLSFGARIEVEGNVDLILADGGTLTASAGIHVPQGSSLTIWQQSGPATGRLSAFAPDTEDAVIGGNADEPGGSVTVNGGSIFINDSYDGAAIGSGRGGSFGAITVNGGDVLCYPAPNAGGAVLGAGSSGVCGDITVNGGAVSAPICSSVAAVIGTGRQGSACGNITITGGAINAKNTNSLGGAVIGAGSDGVNRCGTIAISGGDVYVETAGTTAWAIGLGNETDDCAGVVITGGSVYAAGGAGMIAPQPTNGTEPVYLLEVPNLSCQTVSVDGYPWPPYYDEHGADHVLFAWVTGRSHTVKVGNAEPMIYEFDAATKTFHVPVSVSYYDPEKGQQDPVSATALAGNETVWTEGWYAAIGMLTFPQRITVQGNVDLILTASSILQSLGGINISAGSSLTIWQEQSGQSGFFRLRADPQNAAIGGNANEPGGSVTINGGSIIIDGPQNGAAIGSGQGGSFGDITINGGDIEATATDSAAAIGCGSDGVCGVITVTGGDVCAQGGADAYSIGLGGGTSRCAGVVITGGSVCASGGAGDIGPQPTNGTEPLYLLEIPNPDRQPICIDQRYWTPFYSALAGNETLYAWLTGADHTVQYGDDGGKQEYVFLDGPYGKFVQVEDYDWNTPTYSWNIDKDSLTATVTLTIPSLKDGEEDLRWTVDAILQNPDAPEPADCTRGARYIFYCSRTIHGKQYISTEECAVSPPLGHSWDPAGESLPVQVVTDNDAITVTFFCRNDPTHSQTVPGAPIRLEAECVPATCTEPGKDVYLISYQVGDDTFTLPDQTLEYDIPALGHLWDESTHTCSRCGVPEPKHEEAHRWSLPDPSDTTRVRWSQTAAGGTPYLTVTAVRTSAGGSVMTQDIVISGDDIQIDRQASTCEGAGTITYSATIRLGSQSETYTLTVESAPLNHWWKLDGEPKWAADDSQVAGHFVCRWNPEHIADVTAPATRQTLQSATCTEPGQELLSATLQCGGTSSAVQKTADVPALGHDYNGDGVCTRCGARKPQIQPASSASATAPDTGDRTTPLTWTLLLLACGAALAIVAGRRRKN